jgi:thiamine-monophosphate kinase
MTQLSEFEMIKRYFDTPVSTPFVALGIGDDCAVLTPTAGKQLLVSTDMLNEGRHFTLDALPEWIAQKALAVNLSDLAACGATPKAFFLSIGLPKELATDEWLAPFAQSLHSLANKYGCALAGGDTTRSEELTISITVLGESPAPLLRSGAKAGDMVWVSGTLGDAALGLALTKGEHHNLNLSDSQLAHARQRLHTPSPRVKLGIALRGLATSCVDVSDGLAGDLLHLLKASDVDAVIDVDALPMSPALRVAQDAGIDVMAYALSGGDDYELLFTAPASARQAVIDAAASVGVAVTPIGSVAECATVLPALQFCDDKGEPWLYNGKGYEHF